MSHQQIRSNHQSDVNGNPFGGDTKGLGLSIIWQRGPLRAADGEVKEPNGCFVETVIEAAKDRLDYYQGTKFACDDNAEAIEHLNRALVALGRRTASRIERKVEGTHEV